MGVTVVQVLDSALAKRASPAEEDSTGQGLIVRCVQDIQAKPVRWLWHGRFARGKVSLIAGHPGLGKSQIGLSMAGIGSTGGLWPVDRTRCERGSVVILSAEDDAADTIRPRLEAAGADLSRIHIIDAVPDGFNAAGTPVHRAFNLSADLGRLESLLKRLCDVALILIDPASAYLGKVESHSNAEVRALLAPLADLAARYSAAVVGISHLSKAAGTEALLRIQGSVAFAAAARAAWGVARDKEDPARRLFLPLKNNIGTDEAGLAFRIESYQLPSGIRNGPGDLGARAGHGLGGGGLCARYGSGGTRCARGRKGLPARAARWRAGRFDAGEGGCGRGWVCLGNDSQGAAST